MSMQPIPWPAEYDPPAGVAYWREWREKIPAARPVVVLHGGYGKRNLGDDAILHVLLGQLREAMSGAQIIVLCHGPEWVRREHGAEAHHFASVSAWRAILAADFYLIGGGGIINRINVYSGWRRGRWLDPKGKFLFLAALAAGAHGARVVFHAIGATSVPDPVVGWLAQVALRRADAVSVRDPLSRQVLAGLGVRREIRLVPDPAALLEPAAPEVARAILRREGLDPDGRLIGLNLRPVGEPDADNAQTAATAARLADWLAERHGCRVCFLPFGRHPTKAVEDDTTLAREIERRVRRRDSFHILAHPCSPPEMKAILGEMDFCLLERLHAAILAAGAGTPFLAVSYDDKVSQFMQAIGQGMRIIPLRDFRWETARAALEAAISWPPRAA